MKSRLIVLEGIDGSGKSTQIARLKNRFETDKIPYRQLQFPRYQEESSTLLRMYLHGAFGTDPEDVNAYAASTFFAVDRYAAWKQDWHQDYEAGKVIITDRYTTSNAVHQASKLNPENRTEFRKWLFHYEYELLGIPAPDLVILLDIDPAEAARLREIRNGEGDIHESHSEYLVACRQAALEAAEEYGWHVIQCLKDSKMRSIEDIGEEIDSVINNYLEGDNN